MLTTKAQYRLGDAKEYFSEHLSVGDYYAEGQQVLGQWYGQGAGKLGLSGVTRQDDFVRLCENLHPKTGEKLTLRQNTTRSEIGPDGRPRQNTNRRVFYDFTFSPAKSVSIAALVGHDPRIAEAHEQAVAAALGQLQAFAATRVRKRGQCTDRTTGNIVTAVFRHDTSRALDPQLHTHCIIFNATFDSVEARWKALQNHDMLSAQKFIENVYYHELSRRLRQFGYGIENQRRGDFEIKGVSPALIEKFSKRHQEIDRKTRELLEREPEKATGNVAVIRDHVAHKERARKIKGITLPELRASWDGQLTAEEKASLGRLATEPAAPIAPSESLAERAVAWAEEHLFERRSVVLEHELWRHALEHVRGQNVELTEIQAATGLRGYVRYKRHPGRITTRGVIDREWEIVCLARDGIRRCAPLCCGHSIQNASLDSEQRQAVERILQSRNFVTLFRGGAGTGKSYALRQVYGALRQAGSTVIAVAPQRQQVMDLERDGFQGAQTVSGFLTRGSLPRGGVLLVDEAGQIGGRQMHELLSLAQGNEGRVILSGDTRQHGAVEASDALRAIEKYSTLQAIELTTIRRQDPARGKTSGERERISQYKQAVQEASEGNLAASFRRLDRQGEIVVCPPHEQAERLAERYVTLAGQRQSVVVVSQTWSEIQRVNEQVRSTLKSRGLLGVEDRSVTALETVDLTDAQKRDRRFYKDDTVLVLNRNAGGFQKGQTFRLLAISERGWILEGSDKIRTVPFRFADRLTVCQPAELALAAGDRLQLKTNDRTRKGQRLANGELVTVEHVGADGRIRLTDGRIVEKNYRHFVRGFAITSYASQGKTVDHVLFSDSAVQAATNQQQWYVTISRGRKGITIFTSDKAQLRENILQSGDRTLAIDLANDSYLRRLGIPRWLKARCRRNRSYAEGFRQARLNAHGKLRQRALRQTQGIKVG
ncbi:MAG TPA: MobF family relaxase [Verrucomicrobiae bacterium]|nr:MobF family relaxase [Verrucomicrobiae bacterium]